MSRSSSAKKLVPCTPPLMEKEKFNFTREDNSTKFGGTSCEHWVYAYFLSNKINIAEPFVDNGVDCLIERENEGWKRGQIKKVVYQEGIDYGMKDRHGVEVRRARYNFALQGGGGADRRQRKPEEIDYFYHVLLTCYRVLIWETPSHIYPVREDGSFIQNKTICLDSESWVRKKAEVDYSKYLVYSLYDPIIYQTYPDFFIKPPTGSLEKFL
jgi:hypothetical protein